MKSKKASNLAGAVAFFLIALILTCTVAFASSEWQNQAPNQPDSGETDKNNSQSGNTDENKDGLNNNDEEIPVIKPLPEYLHYLTGTEISAEDVSKRPLCFVYDSNSALYGISSAFLTVEIPTENGNTRFLVFKENDSTGKIGTLAPSRNYINSLAASLGGIVFCYGNDDSFEYTKGAEATVLNFKENQGYHYTEYSHYPYTNSDLVNAFLRNTGVSTVDSESKKSPFLFTDYYGDARVPSGKAKSVIISYGASASTELSYDSESGKYVVSKMGQPKVDLLSDELMQYDNAFILFANSTTYETEIATECVIDTLSGGKGYYMCGGGYEEITWGYDSEGNLTFYSSLGEKLCVNRGNSFISFVKASDMSKVKIS